MKIRLFLGLVLLLVSCSGEQEQETTPQPVVTTAEAQPIEATTPAEVVEAASEPESSTSSTATTDDERDVWSSGEKCVEIVSASRRYSREEGKLRIGTWNIRWFPDGDMRPPYDNPTDIDWLACTIAWLNVDVLAIEEIRTHAKAKNALKALIRKVGEHTGATWRYKVDPCKNPNSQHVGFLYNTDVVTKIDFVLHPELNTRPGNSGCEQNMRPGQGAHIQIADGIDIHFVALHLKSGPGQNAYDERHEAQKTIVKVFSSISKRYNDSDVIFLGDWNTMGCTAGDCEPSITGRQEISELDSRLQGMDFWRVKTYPMCSEYYRGHAGLLDHFVIRDGVEEIAQDTKAVVHGYCKQNNCDDINGAMPAAYLNLSDHCPVTIDIENRDLD